MAYSARFMALLESGAAVLKSTIYSEYYSDQIQRMSTYFCEFADAHATS